MTGVTVSKTSVDEFIDTDRRLTRLVYAYLACAAGWLVVGTLAGLYASLQFVWPDFPSTRALEFGHLRPVHTNVVLWGWASLGTISLALWVVPRTSQKSLFSVPLAWVSLGAINFAVLAGTLQLVSGVTNGAQEYREYVWPVMSVFWIGLVLLAYNLARTVARRSTEEIYISNWYIVGATLWTATLVAVAYVPWYQNGLGETVVQGYYMHTAVGMWFTPMVLGIMYYVLPKLLNKPIYSYSLGVLAFWAQLAFYPLIGAHRCR